jgi:RNA polymerase sigma-70 factor, ECF subfamily
MQLETTTALTEEDRRYAVAVARRIVRTEHEAQDVAQEALLLAFCYRHDFRGEAKFRTWLHRIVVTAALSHLRATSRRQRRVQALQEQPTAMVDTPEQLLRRRQLERQVTTHVSALSDSDRTVLALRLAELSDAEISARLHISVASVKVRGHRARHRLRSALLDAGVSAAA